MMRCTLGFGVAGAVVLLAGCGTPRVSTLDPVIRSYADSARVAYERGMPGKAGELYGLAMERARLVSAPQEAGRSAYNLALCRMAEGRPAEARTLLRQARLTLGHTGPEAARTYVAEAEAAHLEGDTAATAALALMALDGHPDRDGKLQACLTLAELAAGTNDLETAAGFYRRAAAKESNGTPPLLRARLEGLAVRLIRGGMMEGDAALRLDRRAEWLRAAGQYREMALSLRDAGDAFAVSERPGPAFDRFVRAAQSLSTAGARDLARECARRAKDVAERLPDPACVAQAGVLWEAVSQ